MKVLRVVKYGTAAPQGLWAKLSSTPGHSMPSALAQHANWFHVVGRMPALTEQRALEALEFISCRRGCGIHRQTCRP